MNVDIFVQHTLSKKYHNWNLNANVLIITFKSHLEILIHFCSSWKYDDLHLIHIHVDARFIFFDGCHFKNHKIVEVNVRPNSRTFLFGILLYNELKSTGKKFRLIKWTWLLFDQIFQFYLLFIKSDLSF